ncbi:hypothetical protein EMGBS7_07230 [Candidatus Planktophila sp.]|nr:hypothetical protein EMGBS7_07230 [Candidatus Planktophila sp.]
MGKSRLAGNDIDNHSHLWYFYFMNIAIALAAATAVATALGGVIALRSRDRLHLVLG